MKNTFFYTALSLSLLIFGCGKDDSGNEQEITDLNITFTGSFGTDVLQMQKEYSFCDGRSIKFTTFDFFVSELVLLKTDNNGLVTQLKDVDFVSLSFTNEGDAMAGQTLRIQGVPVGNYSGISFALGIPSDVNKTDPGSYGSSSPLSNTSFYWDGWGSYIFAKIEGFADLNNDGTITQGGADTEGFTYHTGSDAVYTEVTLTKDFVLETGVDGAVSLNVDLGEAFDMTDPIYDANSDGCLDIETYNGTHTDGQLEIAKKIMENLSKNFTISL